MVSYKVSLISPLTLKSCLSCRASIQHLPSAAMKYALVILLCCLVPLGRFIPHEIITVVVWSIIYIYIYVM